MARPSEYNFDLCIEICDEIANGKNITEVLDSKDVYPSWSTFRIWKRDNDELQTLYTRSIQDKAEMVVSEIDQTLTDVKNGLYDVPTGRLIIDTLKWKAAKYYPKMFGDKIQQEHSGEIRTTPLLTNDPITNDGSDNGTS